MTCILKYKLPNKSLINAIYFFDQWDDDVVGQPLQSESTQDGALTIPSGSYPWTAPGALRELQSFARPVFHQLHSLPITSTPLAGTVTDDFCQWV